MNTINQSSPGGRIFPRFLFRRLLSLFLVLLLAGEALPVPVFAAEGYTLPLVSAVLTEEGSLLTFTYDENGLLLRQEASSAQSLGTTGNWTYTWNSDGTLRSAASQGKTLSFRYDSRGDLAGVTVKENGKTSRISYESIRQGGLLTKRQNLTSGKAAYLHYQYAAVPAALLDTVKAQQSFLLSHPEFPLAESLKGTNSAKERDGSLLLSKASSIGKVKKLKAARTEDNGILLTWKAVSGAKKYLVYQKAPGASAYKKAGTVKTTSFTLAGDSLKAGYAYSYYVLAVDSKGKKGKQSAAVTLKTLGKVKNAAAELLSDEKLSLTWKKDSLASGYEAAISASKKASGIRDEEVISVKTNRLTTDLSAGKHYLYVRSLAKSGSITAHGPWTKVSCGTSNYVVKDHAVLNVPFSLKSSSAVGEVPLHLTYSDGFFTKSSRTEQKDLAILSLVGAATSYEDPGKTKSLLNALNFTVPKDYLFSGDGTEGGQSTLTDYDHARVLYGFRSFTDNGQENLVAAIVISGYTDRHCEWISNFNLGQGDTVAGFEKAAQECYELTLREVKSYLLEHPATRVSYWIMGHSRGAAISNLLAARLSAEAGEEQVYAYTFATPAVSQKVEATKNIYNYVLQEDFITYLAPSAWGYQRNGKDIVLSCQDDAVKASFTSMQGKNPSFLTKANAAELANLFVKASGESRESYYKNRGTLAAPLIPAVFCMQGIGYMMNRDSKTMMEGMTILSDYAKRDASFQALYNRFVTLAVGGQITDSHQHLTYLAALQNR